MMRRITSLVTLFLSSFAIGQLGFAADTINTDVVVHVDPYGDGSMKMTFHLSASQWMNWRQQYGDHPDVLWRDLKQKFAKYALDKFDLQKNDIERTATADIEGRAFTHVRGHGNRGIEIPKDFRLVSNSGLEWVFESTSQASPYSPILTQTSRVILPPQATNVRIDQPGTTAQQIVYHMPDSSGGNGMLFWAGLLALGGGILLAISGFIFSRRPPPLPA